MKRFAKNDDAARHRLFPLFAKKTEGGGVYSSLPDAGYGNSVQLQTSVAYLENCQGVGGGEQPQEGAHC